MKILGIDSGSTVCGVSIFEDETLIGTRAYVFREVYSKDKFSKIINTFKELIEETNPDIIVIEDPLAVRSGWTTRVLNQIGGGIMALGVINNSEMHTIHNKTLKKVTEISSKEDSINKVVELYNYKCETSDESDAVLVVKTYHELNRKTS